jgi:hypothetical protein
MHCQFDQFTLSDNLGSGFAIGDSTGGKWGDTALQNSLLVQSVDRIAFATRFKNMLNCHGNGASAGPCQQVGTGFALPGSHRFVTSGVVFVNYTAFPAADRPEEWAWLAEHSPGATEHLGDKAFKPWSALAPSGKGGDGGWEQRFSGIRWVNSTHRASVFDEFQLNWQDLDGSLAGTPGSVVVVSSGLLPWDKCQPLSKDLFGARPLSISTYGWGSLDLAVCL